MLGNKGLMYGINATVTLCVILALKHSHKHKISFYDNSRYCLNMVAIAFMKSKY